MSDKFAKDVITELNKFRNNPKYIQHQCEIIRTGFSRLKATDSFLTEIEAFIKELNSLKPMRSLQPNDELTEAAKKELPNFRGSTKYQKYKKSGALKGIIPDHYFAGSVALCADDGAEEPINVLTKVLLNKLDKAKEGRKILCDSTFTQVGIAHEIFDQENMVIMIFATEQSEPIHKTKNEFLKNIQYHESKDIKNPKYEVGVHHRIKGDIFGESGRLEYESQMFSQGENRPRLEGNANPQKLRGAKSELKMTTKTTTTTSKTSKEPANTRGRAPVTATAKSEKVQETRVGRRNEGTSLKTETRNEKKTTNAGLRGKPNESSVTTTTTKKTTVEKPAREVKKTEKTSTTTTTKTTTTTTRTVRGGDKGTETKTETKKTVSKVEESKGGEKDGGSVRQKYAKRKFGK